MRLNSFQQKMLLVKLSHVRNDVVLIFESQQKEMTNRFETITYKVF